ncbi:MAG: type II toxin-antitoxin system prevent-host-death family antitoxin [Acidobacteria bacterium]|nr:type II toxin-antitoxin system prevent-host-death family antitoxin [Acidobacteriota bacterium]
MESVGIRQLKAELSQRLRRVQQGMTIVVTDRGRVIATIQPVASSEASPVIERMRQLAAEGKVIWSGGKPKGSNPPVQRQGRATVSDAVLEDRG